MLAVLPLCVAIAGPSARRLKTAMLSPSSFQRQVCRGTHSLLSTRPEPAQMLLKEFR